MISKFFGCRILLQMNSEYLHCIENIPFFDKQCFDCLYIFEKICFTVCQTKKKKLKKKSFTQKVHSIIMSCAAGKHSGNPSHMV